MFYSIKKRIKSKLTLTMALLFFGILLCRFRFVCMLYNIIIIVIIIILFFKT